MNPALRADAPIGVFDSGVGGLSVLRHIQQQLPREHLLYFSDALHAPYGPRSEAELEQRALAIGAYFQQRGVKAIVVACNTATAAGIAALRRTYPILVVVGVEPGLKPAASVTLTRVVGVLATEATLASDKFNLLRAQIATASEVRFLLQPCAGLAAQIERGDFNSSATLAMLRKYVLPLVEQGADTLVLGCTHYPLVRAQIAALLQDAAAPLVRLIDTGEAVAQQLARVLTERAQRSAAPVGWTDGITSGEPGVLADAFGNLLGQQVSVSTAK